MLVSSPFGALSLLALASQTLAAPAEKRFSSNEVIYIANCASGQPEDVGGVAALYYSNIANSHNLQSPDSRSDLIKAPYPDLPQVEGTTLKFQFPDSNVSFNSHIASNGGSLSTGAAAGDGDQLVNHNFNKKFSCFKDNGDLLTSSNDGFGHTATCNKRYYCRPHRLANMKTPTISLVATLCLLQHASADAFWLVNWSKGSDICSGMAYFADNNPSGSGNRPNDYVDVSPHGQNVKWEGHTTTGYYPSSKVTFKAKIADGYLSSGPGNVWGTAVQYSSNGKKYFTCYAPAYAGNGNVGYEEIYQVDGWSVHGIFECSASYAGSVPGWTDPQ
ncbi:hypothetical protein M409DRAFT_29978 [Zasmidium cellare ATCC 36951]|uniref:Uncharacterized protein n=1 Tax=Zasmidium cellare ATCC 36951 TaxID=1080233 RepID=A0A6A6BXS7_ZASCE|nr:uncharacterized protein M409DRAFT_29978 [Zasmidium cellare ATCC 36951]KAF2159505.1 hypothetical protein M409DRAFT_29978 [Zasmidium cellare ATCC 36951]